MRPRKLPAVIGGGLSLAALTAGCHDSSSPAPPESSIQKAHVDVVLKDRLGNAIPRGSQAPYSPRQTCGSCHDLDTIANAYHFQQGRTDKWHQVVNRNDYFHDGRAFLRSAGMYGKW